MNSKRSTVLFIVIAFFFLVAGLITAILHVLYTHYKITKGILENEDVRYGYEAGGRYGLWVWRYKYKDWVEGCSATSCCHNYPYSIGDTIESIDVCIEDKDNDRKLDEGDINVTITPKSWRNP